MKNSYFVSGYWKKNLGDDLFLYILCKRYPDRNFIISSEKENTIVFQNVENLKILEKNYLIKLLNKISLLFLSISFVDLYAAIFTRYHIEIGGSIFIESENWRSKLKQRIFHLNKSKDYFIIGSNFGPYSTKDFLDSYRSFFEKCKVVFRDEESKRETGVDTLNVAPDVIFGLKKYIDDEELVMFDEDKYIVISVINLSSSKAHREEKIKELSDMYEEKIYSYGKYLIDLGYKIKLMSFCDFEEDNISIERIYNKFNDVYKNKIHKYSHNSIIESLSILKKSEKIVATRFHATVLGWGMNVPTLSIAYSAKTKNVSRDLFREECQVLEIEEFINMDNESLMERYVLVEDEVIRKISLESENQFSYLDYNYE